MTEEFSTSHDATAGAHPAPVPETGHPVVDDLLGTLESLKDQPIDEHVAVFERAHDQLRAVLDGPRPPRP